MIDFHSHILPGLDDGPADIDESIAMAAALHDAGFKTIYGTPHLMKGCFEADNQAVILAASTLQARLHKENIEMEILPGREYYLDEFLDGYLKDPLPLGKTQYIMIEIPNNATAEYVKETCFKVKLGGFIPMIAHPERCRLFAAPQKSTTSRILFFGAERKNSDTNEQEPALIDYLKEIGCAFQGNLGSFDNMYGPDVQQTANYLKKQEVYTHFGTDAHSLRAITRLFLQKNVKSE
jgi:protein-tyrosine phosphatase